MLKKAVVLSLFLTAVLSQAAVGKIIQGEVSHKEFLPPVPVQYRKGSVLENDPSRLRVEWFPVPDWMAGTWTKDGDVETYEKDFRSGRESRRSFWLSNRVTLEFGHQVDAKNIIWHAEVLPFRADGSRGRARDQRYVLGMSCLDSSPRSVSLRFHSAVVTVGDSSGRIVGSRQQEEIVQFFPSSPGMIATKSSTKTFTDRGKPLYRFDSHTKRRRTADFQPIDSVSGIDLRKQFRNFLVSKNMLDRLPRD